MKDQIDEQSVLFKVTETLFKVPDLQTAFSKCVALIREGWSYPERIAVRILLADGTAFTTPGFTESDNSMSSAIERDSQLYVRLDVYYTITLAFNRPVFTAGQRTMIARLSELLSIYLDQWHSMNKLKESEARIKNVTAHIPGNFYQFQMNDEGEITILFANKGMGDFNNHVDVEKLKESGRNIAKVIHPDDHESYFGCLRASHFSLEDISVQYRAVTGDVVSWRWMWARAEKLENGEVMWYGCTKDITPIIEYVDILEQIVFDISHIIRRPVTTILGLTDMISRTAVDEYNIKDLAEDLKTVAAEMDDLTRRLNKDYSEKMQQMPELRKGHQLVNSRTDYFRKMTPASESVRI